MSPHFEQVVVFSVMSVLVTLFTWIYLRDPQQRVGLWMIGWVAIFTHFAAHLMWSFSLLPENWAALFHVATLEIAGVSFVLSVSEVFSTPRRRLFYIVAMGAPSVVYLICLIWTPKQFWIFPILLSASLIAVSVRTVIHYGQRNFTPYLWLVILGPYFAWTLLHILRGDPDAGISFYLAMYFVVAGVLYMRHYRRFTPGVTTTSVAFIAWGLVWPVGDYLAHLHIGPPDESVFWDLPKYFVAFGMILTLFENETAIANRVADRYQILFEGNLAGVYVSTISGRMLDCNSAFFKMYGYESKEEVRLLPAECLYASRADRAAFLDQLHHFGHVINYECRQRKKDGTVFWILERATIVSEPSGRKLIEGTAIDITERKQTEMALRQSEERFSTIFRNSPAGCGIVSLEGVFLNVNDALLKMFGRPAEEVIGKTGVELGLWKSQEERNVFYQRLRAEGSIKNMELIFKDAAGNPRVCLYFGTLVRVGDRECIFGMQLDYTEQRELEAKFLQAQKMEALGRLAGGIAHDFNNLLGVIGGYAELLESRLNQNETYRRYCSKILETTQRASGLTSQLLTFSRKEIARPAPMKPNKAIRELAGILPRLIGEDIEMVLDLKSNGTIVIDKIHFEQIIFNIVVNSRDAMPNGGQLTITTEDTPRPMLDSSGKVTTGDFVSITISDTGIGMDEETRLHACEPFFTTKTGGRGTGLGLSTVYGIVHQCRGDLSIKSQLNQGTQITILLPATKEMVVSEKEKIVPELLRGAGHILLVEDEIELRNANAEFLTSVGYSVICAGSGIEALEILSNGHSIDLVISDVVMPKMSGREFADRLQALRPSTKVLFISGYTDDVILQAGISASGTPFLQKPFTLRQLATKVQELLSAAVSK